MKLADPAELDGLMTEASTTTTSPSSDVVSASSGTELA